ncbi:MAG: fatty acid desaturase, partial [Methanosarcinales archaeon]
MAGLSYMCQVRFSENEVRVNDVYRAYMIKAHPEIEKLMVRRIDSAFYVWAFVLAQVGLTIAVSVYQPAWYWVLAIAYFAGAVLDHSLWVLIHDLTHNAVFESRFWNLAYHCIANLPHIFPSAISFKYYHAQHHAHLNEAYADPDLPGVWENKIFGTTPVGKTCWLACFAIIQSVRTLRYKPTLGGLEGWCAVNWVTQLSFNYAVYHFLGTTAFVYMLISSMFAIGLHPLGARWVAEHYAVRAPQETYSYYGSFNFLGMNIGYHNEHHDFPSIPWQLLPELKAMAPEFYNNLWHHTSYWRVLLDFIFCPSFTLESRVVRSEK